ncbi:dipicolinate synthase subunit B [Vallitalea pronyensis]|uniref:Dipicolinate synthase subunit B n=1 Tax=Vallitalea pronyensis TaxID=1348613 RepID=A0A8J8MKC9_9FIRM|nr:dipicolinate synthase subunit B [Vallitalea pronyensis]QUI23032.1 dipicolinate synthase subunit B [Vallitalea pronyensis]
MKALEGIKIGFAVCGSFCTIAKVFEPIKRLMDDGAEVYPMMSVNAASIDTRFGKAEDFKKELETITGNPIQTKIEETEQIGPQKLYDILVVAPCTGNTMAKLANAITDTSVLMAMKATLRNAYPVVIAIATNDGLGLNLKNFGVLMNTEHVYFVPFGQDNYKKKKNSLVAKMDLIYDTILEALEGRQIQPVLVEYE